MIKKDHPWAGHRIKDVTSLPDLLLVLILRGEERIVPNGDTVIMEGDKIVLSALSPEENLGLYLSVRGSVCHFPGSSFRRTVWCLY